MTNAASASPRAVGLARPAGWAIITSGIPLIRPASSMTPPAFGRVVLYLFLWLVVSWWPAGPPRDHEPQRNVSTLLPLASDAWTSHRLTPEALNAADRIAPAAEARLPRRARRRRCRRPP